MQAYGRAQEEEEDAREMLVAKVKEVKQVREQSQDMLRDARQQTAAAGIISFFFFFFICCATRASRQRRQAYFLTRTLYPELYTLNILGH
jgi:hypothetical protein